MVQNNSENTSPGFWGLSKADIPWLALIGFLVLIFVALMVADYMEDSALPEVDAYKVQKNSEHHLTIMCIDGYRYLMNDAAVRYAVQIWENGPEGPRLSQCPRKKQGDAVDAKPGE